MFEEAQEYSMSSLADQLPPDIAAQIDPLWRKNEADYWAARAGLLDRYRDQWIGFADGAVIASGKSPVAVFDAAEESGRSPFVTCVGREHEPIRMRRAVYVYDVAYPGEPLPVLDIEFRGTRGTPGVVFDRVIADTGADSSAIPWTDCQRLQLDPKRGRPGMMGGSQVEPRRHYCFESGSSSMDASIHAGCRRILSEASEFSDATY